MIELKEFSSPKKLYSVSGLDFSRKDRDRLLAKAAEQTKGKKLPPWRKELGHENLEFPRDPFIAKVNKALGRRKKETNHVFNPHVESNHPEDPDWHEDDGLDSNWLLMIAIAPMDFMGTVFYLDGHNLRLLANRPYVAHIDLTHSSPWDKHSRAADRLVLRWYLSTIPKDWRITK